jgi:methylenetetrahydrofolate--tRNA-(uracil-5-)-methyltransferase
MHRNTYLDSPALLDCFYRLKKDTRIFFAGQMTGVEGYVESASSGLSCGINCARIISGKSPVDFTDKTAIGALAHYVSGGEAGKLQPMNVNFGIMPQLSERIKNKAERYRKISQRALCVLSEKTDEMNNDKI